MYMKIKMDLEVDSLLLKEIHDLEQSFDSDIHVDFDDFNLEYY